jgi:hypothetical protein
MAVLPAFFFAALSIIGTIYGISAIFIGSNLVRFWELGVMGLVALLFSYVASYDMIGIAFLSPEDEPIRFHRRDKKIYCYRARHWRFFGLKLYSMGKPTVHVVDWVHCRAEVSRRLITTGKTARRDCFLELAILDPKSHTVAERFPVGDRDVFSDFSSRILLWETIRRYMEEGTERVPPAVPKVHRGTFIDCIEEFNPFSMPAKSAAGAQRAFGYFFGAILLTIGLLLLPMALSRWLSMKASRKIDWGELEESTFKIASDDPARHHASQPDEIDRRAWEGELKRRRKAAMMWLTVSALQLAAVWWYLFDPNYYE